MEGRVDPGRQLGWLIQAQQEAIHSFFLVSCKYTFIHEIQSQDSSYK